MDTGGHRTQAAPAAISDLIAGRLAATRLGLSDLHSVEVGGRTVELPYAVAGPRRHRVMVGKA
jgi:hypothetical protein|nr:hypothetical protein JVH1_8822 [Rhodococcus sp. JVH1]